ncbi:MAG: 2-hydroxyacid dehydrogenase [Oscillospiraceae bacterium]|nr:2-hydroxyacid dehydrogenase [Oscillospiraceae bacterium]
MKFEKILIIGIDKDFLFKETWQNLNNLCKEIIVVEQESSEVDTNLANTDCILVTLGATVDKDMMDKAPNLKYIGAFSTGYGRIDTEYATSKGITVCNIAGYSTQGVAELAFALILENIRDVSRAKVQAKNGNYSEATFKGTEIANKKFGIIGLGSIGTRIAEIASNGFNADVMYYSRNRKADKENDKLVYQGDVKTLVQESDFLSLNLAYNNETEKFINKELMNEIKPGAIVINLSPMELIDFEALSKRLQVGDITFILDHSDELTEEQATQLSKYENCIMYPPIGYITDESKVLMQEIFVDNIINYFNDTPTNKVN